MLKSHWERSRGLAFFVHPVRGHDPAEYDEIAERIADSGWDVYDPSHDTDQIDGNGYRICEDNREAIRNADLIIVVWDGKSQGCLFDLSMAFALGKPIWAENLPAQSEGKSFQNMIREWHGKRDKP